VIGFKKYVSPAARLSMSADRTLVGE